MSFFKFSEGNFLSKSWDLGHLQFDFPVKMEWRGNGLGKGLEWIGRELGCLWGIGNAFCKSWKIGRKCSDESFEVSEEGWNFRRKGLNFAKEMFWWEFWDFWGGLNFPNKLQKSWFCEGNSLMNIFNLLMFLQFSLSNFSIFPTNFSDENFEISEEGWISRTTSKLSIFRRKFSDHQFINFWGGFNFPYPTFQFSQQTSLIKIQPFLMILQFPKLFNFPEQTSLINLFMFKFSQTNFSCSSNFEFKISNPNPNPFHFAKEIFWCPITLFAPPTKFPPQKWKIFQTFEMHPLHCAFKNAPSNERNVQKRVEME